MAEERIGEVVKFFAKPSVAAIKITDGVVTTGDIVRFSGHTTDFEETVTSMEVNGQKIENASPGDLIGMKVVDRVRAGDEVFKVISE